MAAHVWLAVDSESDPAASAGVGLCGADSGLMLALARYTQAGGRLRSVFRVTVIPKGGREDDELPEIAGRYEVRENGVWFRPHFPFERGISYRARFDPRPLGRRHWPEGQTLEFSGPSIPRAPRPEVEQVFPSSDQLPQNTLRFYVCFSNAMQRGRVETEITILGPDGRPAPDVLYRAPVELWDASMRRLTILLDPGRLKRGVGPNRELGPPLKAGCDYTLMVGTGMTDLNGGRLLEPVRKHFRVTSAVRAPIDTEHWRLLSPEIDTRQPLVLVFPRPLDWALLSTTIAVISPSGDALNGRIEIDQGEQRWRFTPRSPWAPGPYQIRIAQSLEDVCGNSVMAPFDRPLRRGGVLAYEDAARWIQFSLE